MNLCIPFLTGRGSAAGALTLATLAVLWLGATATHAFPVITNVVETGGDNEPTDTVPAKWTGVTYVGGVANEPVPGLAAGASYTVGPFGNHAPAYVDRNHRWTNASVTVPLPPYLAGLEYIMIGNDNRDNAGLRLNVSVANPVNVYLLIDNRLGDTNNADPPSFNATHMQWVIDEGWAPLITGINRSGSTNAADEIGQDEAADGDINQWFSVYLKSYPAGTFQLRQPDNANQGMYGALVGPLCLCIPPFFTNCPPGYIVRTCGATTNFVYPTPGVLPSCPVTVVCTPASGTPFPVGPTMVTCTAVNCLQQKATCKFTVTVVGDTTPPVIDCMCLRSHAEQLLATNACQAFIPNLCQFTNCFSDNCCLRSCSQSPVAGTAVGPGTHPITVTLTDCAGNTATDNCSLKFVVTEPPGGCDTNCLAVLNEHVTCAANAPGKLNYTFDLKNNTGVLVKYLFLVPELSCFSFMPGLITFNPLLPPGQTVTLSVMIKVNGNCPTNLCFLIAAHNSNLVQCCAIRHCVNNTWRPTLVCRDLTVNCDDDTGALVNYPVPTAVSPCCPGPVTVTCRPPPGLFPIGVTPVTCTVSDACGNTNQCTFSVIVRATGNAVWTWARQAGLVPGVSSAIGGAEIAVDNQGYVFVTGSYAGGTSFPSGPVLPSLGGNDIFLAKYNAAGVLQWAVPAGGSGLDAGEGVAVDAAGNAYITGQFAGTATFGPFNLTSVGGSDIFVAKYDPSGACLWAGRNGGPGDDSGAGIVVAASGNVFATGIWTVGAPQAFLMKVDGNSGAILNTVINANPGGQIAASRAVAVDGAGDPYIAGIFFSQAAFTPFPGCSLPGTANKARVFAFKFDGATLACLWSAHSSAAGATGDHDGTGIAVDSSGAFCYVTAYFNGTAAFAGPASVTNGKNTIGGGQLYDYVIAQLSATSGLANWAIQGGGNVNADEETRGIAVDPAGNPCVTGFLHPNAPNNQVNEGLTVLVSSYSPAGVLRWTRNATDGPAGPGAAENVGLGIAVDRAGCAHVTGAFTEDLTFPPVGLPVATLNANPAGVPFMFVAKMCPKCRPACTNVQVLNLFSGRDAFGLLPGGAFDLQFTTAGAPLFTTANPYVMNASGQNPLWLAGGPNSQWIGPDPSGVTFLADGVYVYTNRFFLCATNQAAITGRWTADDSATIKLNGNPTGVSITGAFAFQNWYPVNITSGFVPGWNTLTFFVTNSPGFYSPTGLRTELTGTACCEPCLIPCIPIGIAIDGGNVKISWPAGTANVQLEATGSLSPPILWLPVAAEVQEVNGRSCVTLPGSAPMRFFRLSAAAAPAANAPN